MPSSRKLSILLHELCSCKYSSVQLSQSPLYASRMFVLLCNDKTISCLSFGRVINALRLKHNTLIAFIRQVGKKGIRRVKMQKDRRHSDEDRSWTDKFYVITLYSCFKIAKFCRGYFWRAR